MASFPREADHGPAVACTIEGKRCKSRARTQTAFSSRYAQRVTHRKSRKRRSVKAREVTPYATRVRAALVGSVFPPLAALASQPILANALGADGRGLAAAAVAPLLLATSAATLGLPEAVTYTIARNRSTLPSAVWKAGAAGVIAAIAAVGGIALANSWLSAGDDTLARLIFMVSFALIPTVLVGIARGAAAGLQEWKLIAAERTLNAGGRLVALVLLLITGHLNVVTASLVLALAPIAGGLVYVVIGRRAGQLPQPETAETARLSSMFHFGLRIWVGAISGFLLLRLDQTLMTPLAGVYELGLYVVAVAVSEVPLIVNGAIRDVTFSSESSTYDAKRVARASRVSTLATTIIAAIIASTLWMWLPPLFGPEFSGAIPVALVLLAAVVLGNPGSVAGAGLSARGHPGLRSVALTAACLVNVILMIVLVPQLGAVGAALATLVGNVMASNLNIAFLRVVGGGKFADFYKFSTSDVAIVVATLKRKTSRST